MNNDNKVETAIAGLNCWASYATGNTCYEFPNHPTRMKLRTSKQKIGLQKRQRKPRV